MSGVIGILGDVAVGAAKSMAAQKGNEFLVETLKDTLRKSNLVSPEVIDNEYFGTALKIAVPALLLWVSTSQKDFLSGQIGEQNAERVQELAKLAIQGASVEVVKPLFDMAVPAIKMFLTAGSEMKELKAGKDVKITQVED